MLKWYYKDLFMGTMPFRQNMDLKNLLLLSLFLIGFSNSIGQINCDSEWVKQKGIRSVTIEPKILNPGNYTEYFEYSTSGNLTYHEKYDDDDKYVMIFNDDELLIWDISFTRADKQSTKWDTSKVFQYSYDSSNNLKTSRYINYDTYKGELYISFSSHIYYEYSDSLIIITEKDYNDFTSSREILVEHRILNGQHQDSLIVLMAGHQDTPLDTFSIAKISYDNLGRVEKIETISNTLIHITDFVYDQETDFKLTETTKTIDLNGVFQKKKVTGYYPRSNELRRTTVTDSKNNIEIRNFDKDKISCGLKFHLKKLNSSNAKVTIEYY